MRLRTLLVTAAFAALSASAAQAADTTVFSNQLGTISPGTTTTDTTGTRSTNPSAATLGNETFATGEWQQRNVRGNGVVGITTDYARDGNGSAFFSTDGSGPSKSDLEYYFSTPMLLSDFEGGSYEWYRDSASTGGPAPAPAYRLAVLTAGNGFAGYLVYEPYLNGTVPEDTWETETIDTGNSLFWSTNANVVLPTACSNRQACMYTLDNLSTFNPGLKVAGFSVGAGSGWNTGTFVGAVDNVSFTMSGETRSYNFEAAGVPEPSAWALMILGFASAGAMIRRRTGQVAA